MTLTEIAARLYTLESEAKTTGNSADAAARVLIDTQATSRNNSNTDHQSDARIGSQDIDPALAIKRYETFARAIENSIAIETKFLSMISDAMQQERRSIASIARTYPDVADAARDIEARAEASMKENPHPERPITEIFAQRYPNDDGSPARKLEESLYAIIALLMARRDSQGRIARLAALSRTTPRGMSNIRWHTKKATDAERAIDTRSKDITAQVSRAQHRAARDAREGAASAGQGIFSRTKRLIAGILLGASMIGGAQQADASSRMLPGIRQNFTAAIKGVTVDGESCARWTREALDRGFKMGTDRLAWQYGVTGDAWTMFGNLTMDGPMSKGNNVLYNAFQNHRFSVQLRDALRPFGSHTQESIKAYPVLSASLQKEMPRGLSFSELSGLRSRLRPGMVVGIYNTKSRHQVRAFNDSIAWAEQNERQDAVTPTTHVAIITGVGKQVMVSHWAGGKVVIESLESMIASGRYRICWIVDVASQRGMRA
ncbi:TPA: hypothetical protein HA251_00610 [Candidatus Woesearchaeota archaeon]|nr:hypothetical protein [Candidatus Woesearchaeota archaeon]